MPCHGRNGNELTKYDFMFMFMFNVHNSNCSCAAQSSALQVDAGVGVGDCLRLCIMHMRISYRMSIVLLYGSFVERFTYG